MLTVCLLVSAFEKHGNKSQSQASTTADGSSSDNRGGILLRPDTISTNATTSSDLSSDADQVGISTCYLRYNTNDNNYVQAVANEKDDNNVGICGVDGGKTLNRYKIERKNSQCHSTGAKGLNSTARVRFI